MVELSGIALVTGAGSGIGQVTALALAKAGCSGIVLVDQNAEGLEQTRQLVIEAQLEVEILLSAGNVTDPAFVDQTIGTTIAKFGRLDFAINCAGVFGPPAISVDLALDEADRVMNINYRGVFLCSRAEIRAMMKNERSDLGDVPGQRGAVVNIASNLAFMAKAGSPVYCASKGAVVSLTMADAMDYSPHGIRVNAVCPGLTDTPLATFNNNPEILKILEPVVDRVPMKRWAKPREIADVAVFLCSRGASFIQGQAICVDGGYSIC